jgi:hypothetical protein
MGYEEFVESELLNTGVDDCTCYRCKETRPPLTYVNRTFFTQPCWGCLEEQNKRDTKSAVSQVFDAIKEYYFDVILGDHYLQLFIVDDIYFKNTIPHDFVVFKKILTSLEPPDRNDIWFLDWIPGYPKIINLDNIAGMKLVNLSNLYKIENNDEEGIIKVGDFVISLPILMSGENKHYSRYSILNTGNDGNRARRIKISKEKCYKLYNTENDNIKSILDLTKNGEKVAIGDLTYRDYVIIKLAIMRNKKFLRTIFEIILEICKSVGELRDSVFLKNSVTLTPTPVVDTSLNLIWNPLSPYKDSNCINLSIF